MSWLSDARARDVATKKIQASITKVEKHFGGMCQLFAAYNRKTARLRDKGDRLVKEIGLYADTETPNLQRDIKQFDDYLAMIQDCRHALVQRLDAKVIEPFKSYGAIVRRMKDHLKMTQNARDREAKQMAQLERARHRTPLDPHIISQAECELQRATMDATWNTRYLMQTVDEIEKQKLRDIKKIFGEFVFIELCFHAKALELYTAAYQSVRRMNEEEDLEPQGASLRQDDDDDDDDDESGD